MIRTKAYAPFSPSREAIPEDIPSVLLLKLNLVALDDTLSLYRFQLFALIVGSGTFCFNDIRRLFLLSGCHN